MKKRIVNSLAVGILLLAGAQVYAHHGTSVSYQGDKVITLNGTVTEFSFAYPHVQLYFDVKKDNGQLEHWSSELPGTPVMLKSLGVGWSKTAIKPGDQIALTCNPSKVATSTVCRGQKIAVNGKVIPFRNANGRGGQEGNE